MAMNIEFGASSDKGKVKIRNEDHYSIIPPSFSSGPFFVAVSDGVGGRKGGQLASVKVLQIIGNYISSNIISKDNVKDLTFEAIERANNDLIATGRINEDLAGMGTTIVICVIIDNTLNFFSVGDSRGYIIDENTRLQQITVDHTWTNELVENGSITKRQAQTHPHRHRLMRAIGVSDEVNPDYFRIQTDGIKWIILCTDGLTEHVTDRQILGVVKKDMPPQETADYLTRLSLRRGGTDNITVVAGKIL